MHLLFLNTGSEDRSQIAVLTRQHFTNQALSLAQPTALLSAGSSGTKPSLSEGEFSPLRQPETDSSQGFLSYGPDTSHFPPSKYCCQHTVGRQRRMRNPTLARPSQRSLSGILTRQSPPFGPVTLYFPFWSFCLPLWPGSAPSPLGFNLLPASSPVILLTDETSRSTLELLPLGLLGAPDLQPSASSAAEWRQFQKAYLC